MSTYQVRSLEEAGQIIKEHERKTKTTYSLLRSTKNFACVDVPACANDENEVRFETVGVPYCGVPFFVAGLKILQCQSYKGRGIRKKKDKERKIKVELNGTTIEPNEIVTDSPEDFNISNKRFSKKRKKNCRPHQMGCTATIILKEVIYYPEFQLYEHSKNHKIAIARQLKESLKSKVPVQKDRIIYVTVPAHSDHFGHYVGVNQNSKKVYVKNDFYGSTEPSTSKKVYCPVKQEKTSTINITKRLKVDEDDAEAKAKEVREILQSIMGLTYKPGTAAAFKELFKDLLEAKSKYQQSMNSLLSGLTNVESQTFTPTHQVLTVQSPNNKVGESFPRVVAVATLPLEVTTSASSSEAIVPQTTVNEANEANSQETSIFIEAMEAIFNSQM